MDWEFIFALILAPFKFLSGLFKSKIGIFLVIAVVAAFIILPRITASTKKPVAVYNQNVPSIKAAPTLVQTSSRAYYVSKYTDDGSIIKLDSFYFFDSGKWQKAKTPVSIDRRYYGQVVVVKR